MEPRLFTPPESFTPEGVRLDAAQSHYLRDVLRLHPGARLRLFDGSGREWPAEIIRLERRGGLCRLGPPGAPETEPPFRVRVIQAAARGEKVDAVLQKCTELGAAAFTILASERAQLRLSGARLEKRLARWRRIVIEAAEQSGRVRVPTVEWLDSTARVRAEGLALALHPPAPGAPGTNWRAARERIAKAPAITIAIGPEGGWSNGDLARLDAAGFIRLGFGPRILRTETAAPALLAAIQAVR
ncbi:MAG: 16S rRNA (uracil(1498)-N(3))-methyltransferase [Mariprofundaceae bacterium]